MSRRQKPSDFNAKPRWAPCAKRWVALSPWVKYPAATVTLAAVMLGGLLLIAPPGRSSVKSATPTAAARTAAKAATASPTEPHSPRNNFAAAQEFIHRGIEPADARPVEKTPPLSPPVTVAPPVASSSEAPKIEPADKPIAASTDDISIKPRETTGANSKVDDFAQGGGLEGREEDLKYNLTQSSGGSRESEACVHRGLRWLVAHQRENGGWRFDHHQYPCYDQCSHPGTSPSTTGATALALLCFYGAGYTHKNDSEFKDVVNRGLFYLGSRMLNTPDGGDLQEGTMYAQGLGAICLCEAYAMSKDDNLRPFAQAAIDFIVYSQDKKGGGWRYFPGQPGDTSSFGWQLMALKSAKLAGLTVPPNVIYLATRFLDSVETDGGAGYGYLTKQKEPTTTSIGLLCRMYTGWTREHAGIKDGVAFLAKSGPSKNDMYYNYYATQCLHNWDGNPWREWNQKMREYLIATQASRGHESGSWYFEEEKTRAGGRLYNTCMAIMTLEVYYRYMPLNSYRALDGQ